MSGEDSEARLEAEALRSGGYRVERIIRQMVDGGDFKATLTHKLEGGLLEFVITTNGSGSAITMMEPDEVRDLHRALERYLQKEE